MDRDPADVAGDDFHFAGVDSGPKVNAEGGDFVVECRRSSNCPLGTIEKAQDPIAGGLHDPAAIAVENEWARSLWAAGMPSHRWSPRCWAVAVESTMSVNYRF